MLTIAHGDGARSISSIFAIDTKNILVKNYRILSGWAMGFYSYRVENITLDGFRLTFDEKSPCIVTKPQMPCIPSVRREDLRSVTVFLRE